MNYSTTNSSGPRGGAFSAISCPAWWGICRFLRAIKTNPHLYPGMGWVGVYFDWCITVSAWNPSQPINDRQITSGERSSSGSTFSFRIPPSDSDLFAPNLFGELEFRRILLCCAWCGEFDIGLDLSFWTPTHGAG